MDIDVPFRDWGPVDMDALREAVLAQDEAAWREVDLRQNEYAVHKQTQSIVLLFCSTTWPEVTITKEAGWRRLADVAEPLMNDIIERFYQPGGGVLRAMAAKLLAGQNISPHQDSLQSFHYGHRIHVPLTTNNRVRFMIDGRPHRMEVGHAYEINNQKQHSVLNAGKEDRITFIFDYVPPEIASRPNVKLTHA